MTDKPDRPPELPFGDDSPEPAASHPAPPRDAPAPAAAPVTAPTPAIVDDVEHKLDPRSIPAARTAGGIVVGVLAAANVVALLGMLLGGASAFWLLLVFSILVVVLGAMGAFVWFHPALRYRYAAYRVNDQGIQIKDGILWRSVVNVPRSRVQHTDVSQGPLARAYGLATLIIHTAGTENASVALDGLSRENAYAIRDHLIEAGEGDAV